MRTEPIAEGNEPPLAVRRLEAGRFLCRSERPACRHWYLVDFSEPTRPHGICTCEDYSIRIEPFISRHEEPEKTQCKHVLAVLSEIEHAKELCDAAGIDYSETIIPAP